MIRSGFRSWKTSEVGATLLSVDAMESRYATTVDRGVPRRGPAVRGQVQQRHAINLARGLRPNLLIKMCPLKEFRYRLGQ